MIKLKDIPKRLRASPPALWLKARTKQIFLPGFEGLPLYDVAAFFFRGLSKGALVTRASAVSFTIFLALLPSALLFLSLISYIPIENMDGELLERFKTLLPAEIYGFIEMAIDDLAGRKHSTVMSIGFLLTVYYASNSVNAILVSFSSSYHLTIRRSPIRQRLIALMLIVILSFMILIGLILMIFSDYFFDWLRDNHYAEGDFIFIVLYISKWTLIAMLFMFSISLLYNIGNTEKTSWRIVNAGSTLATVLTITVSYLFAYYVTHYGQWNKIYGSLGTLIVLLLWIYFNALILLIGFELNVAINNAKRKKIELLEEYPDPEALEEQEEQARQEMAITESKEIDQDEQSDT